MKTRIIMTVVVAFAVAFLLTAALRAQEPAKVAGKWEMSFEGPQGPVTRPLTIEQDGENIKGTMGGPRGDTPFTGTVKDKNITMVVKRQRPDGSEVTIEYKGTVEGDSMKGTVEMMGGSREWTAKRAK